MSESRTLMVVAGGEWQIPLIQKAKAMGLRVVNTNLYEDSPGFAHADEGIVADVLDKERNLEIARRVRPDAIVTDQSDIAVPTVAYLCEELGLSGIGTEIAERFTNKAKMREFRTKHGFPNPRYRSCSSLVELEEFFDEGGGEPIVVKPPASQSSRGVTMVGDRNGLGAAFAAAGEFARNAAVLAEGHVGGTEITVEGLKLPDRHLTLAVSVKEHYAHNLMVASRLLYAGDFAEFDVAVLIEQHNRFIETAGLPFGITHTEYKVENGEFQLIEAAARGGGTKVSSHIIPLMSGVDANEVLLRMALGEDPGVVTARLEERVTVLQFFDFDHGKVVAVHGLNAAQQLPGVVDIGLSFSPGDTLNPSLDDRSRHMHVIAWAPSLSETEQLVLQVRDCISIEYA